MLTVSIGKDVSFDASIISKSVERALLSAAEDGRTHALRSLEASGAWDIGTLADSLHIGKDRLKSLEVSLYSNAPHALVTEYGGGPAAEKPRPGWYPPHDPIARWAKKNLQLSAKEADKVAYAIQAAIEKRGIKPRPYMRPAAEHMVKQFPIALRRETERTVKERR